MNLAPGQRLTSGDQAAYQVVGPGWSNDRQVFLRARKVFWNAREGDDPLYEAGDDEWLDVLLRMPRALDRLGEGQITEHDLPAWDQRRLDADFELERVLGRPEFAWFARPIDRIDLALPGPEGAPCAVLLVLADPHGTPACSAPMAVRLRVCREVLAMLAALEAEGLMPTHLDMAEFACDASGRWTFFGTDLIRETAVPGAFRAPWLTLCWPVLMACCPGQGLDEEAERWTPGTFERVLDGLKPSASLDAPALEELARLTDLLRRMADWPDTAGELLRGRSRPGRITQALRRALAPWRKQA